MSLVIAGNGPSGYFLTKSLRFRSSASAYMNRTPSVAGNRQKFTWSGWVKRGTLGSIQQLFSATAASPSDDTNLFGIAFDANDCLITGGGATTFLVTTQVFRDPSAWYHIVAAFDTTQATASNRIKFYVNGTQITAFSTANYTSLNLQTAVNNTVQQDVSSLNPFLTRYFDGYMDEVYLIDGQQLTPSSFGSTNSLTGVWQPAQYTGTYGTNGFYLPFTTTTSTTTLGNDFSGNGNNYTTNNFSLTAGVTYDSMTDVPTLTSATTANFCLLNPLDIGQTSTLSEANLRFASSSSANYSICRSTIGVSSGKWYWEVTSNSTSTGNGAGIAKSTAAINNYLGSDAGGYCYYANGDKYNNGTGAAYGATYTTNDVIGVALDMDAGTLVFYKNNTSQGTAYSSISGTVFPAVTDGSGGNVSDLTTNFGQRPFSYTPPSGYVALNTYNLPTSTIVKGNTVMDSTIYTGNGTTTGNTQTVTNAGGFKPDLVWIKSRSATSWHVLTDSVRGVNQTLYSNSTFQEESLTNVMNSFNSNGFTAAYNSSYTSVITNANGATYVGWQWQAGQGTTSSNTSGSITSTVGVNATAGFSVVTYAGTGAAATVGHGLGVAPQFLIVKNRTLTDDWCVYSLPTGAANYSQLNLNSAFGTNSTIFNSTTPTSSVFSVGTYLSKSGSNYVAYCWTPIAGFSAIGSYTGNGSADGPFIYLGFKPKYIMVKRTDSTGYWTVFDTTRNPYNSSGEAGLWPNAADAEANYTTVDMLSNGTKIRETSITVNANGGSYIYAAFAENSFRNALAR